MLAESGTDVRRKIMRKPAIQRASTRKPRTRPPVVAGRGAAPSRAKASKPSRAFEARRSGAAAGSATLKVRPEIARRTHEIWDAIAGRSGTRVEEAANQLMAALCELHSCDNAYWIGAARLPVVAEGDPLHGWRAGAMQQLKWLDRHDAAFARSRKLRRLNHDIPLTTSHHVRMAGVFRATRLRDLVPASWFKSKDYAWYLENDWADTVTVIFPVSECTESYFMFVRNRGQRRFDTRTRDALAYALRGLRWFHRHLLLFHGVLGASAPLSLTERGALRCLLSGGTDKDIAAVLGIGLHGAREHVATLYRKFDVSSRTELMALWLG
jgi:DNA-binding CsgD family transcriptional regulator